MPVDDQTQPGEVKRLSREVAHLRKEIRDISDWIWVRRNGHPPAAETLNRLSEFVATERKVRIAVLIAAITSAGSVLVYVLAEAVASGRTP